MYVRYVQGQHSKKEYILSPNPVSSTADYFWRLVWETNVGLIVMLGELEEVSVWSIFYISSFIL